ncbi:hypothetical protein [Marinilactibacillus psychrotolerans]|uniref:hypothetical protein n=1 Tax=Marinilactibacillus psychrotolerans TaxID=191770 RepID=UPI0039B0740F
MEIIEIVKEKLWLRIFLYLLIGIPVGLLMVDNELILGLGLILLFVVALKEENSKQKK